MLPVERFSSKKLIIKQSFLNLKNRIEYSEWYAMGEAYFQSTID